ncbi:MAG: hypothetical protein N2053_11405 [Chitinispirillaceae bacterium]|nr:hypothetical protein [Chitinispirillaceae bacterium]
MKKYVLITITIMILLTSPSYPCFDTYLFLQKGSMVYPEKQFVIESSGEYVIPDINMPGEDLFSGNLNIYYGITKNFSIQAGIMSSEKERSSFKIDSYGIRGVYGIVKNFKDFYNLDVILEHHGGPFEANEFAFELSAPSIFHVKDFTYVIHPVFNFGKNVRTGIAGHGGAFYRIKDIAIIGIGAEYASAQSGNKFGERLVEGETATSIFLGARIGFAYLQNEFIKGWGSNSNDFGFAATVKFIILPFSKK